MIKLKILPRQDVDESTVGDISEEELDEAAEGGLGLSNADKESSGEKTKSKRSAVLPLINNLIETPRTSINSALDKWVSDGKSLGRSQISMVLFTLRKRRLWGKALQVLSLS